MPFDVKNCSVSVIISNHNLRYLPPTGGIGINHPICVDTRNIESFVGCFEKHIDWANAHCEAAARVVRRAASERPSGSWPCMIAQVVGKNTKGTTESRALIVCFDEWSG